VGGTAVVVFALAVVFRRPAVLAWALVLYGAEYAVFLGFRTTVDRWAPLVAGAVFFAAELGYRAIEPSDPVPEREVVVRGALWLAGAVLAAVALGSMLLAAAGGANAGLGFEALGVVATIGALTFLVGVVARAARY
jgi:hypothetical protein